MSVTRKLELKLDAMRKVSHTLLLMCGLIMTNLSISQVNQIDSVQNELLKGGDINRTLSYISERTRIHDPSTIAFANLGLEYAVENNLKDWQVDFLLGRARGNKFLKNYSKMLLGALEAIQIIEENALGGEWKSQANFMAAVALKELGAYSEAIEVRKSQLDWAKESKQKGRYLNHINSIGLIFYRIPQYDSAIVYFKQVLKYAEEKSMWAEKASALNNIGLGYYQQRKLDSAKYYFERAHPLFMQGNTQTDRLMASLVGGNLSQCYSIQGNEVRIKSLLNTEIRVTKKYAEYSSLPTAYLRMATLYEALKNYNTAISYVDSAYQVLTSSEKSGNSNLLYLEVLERYVALLDKVNDSKSALTYARKYIEIYKGLYGEDATRALALSKVSYQVSGIQRELELKKTRVLKLEKEEQYSTLKMGLIIAICISIILIALMIILKMKSEYKKKRVVEDYSKQLLENSIENKNQMLTQTMLNLTRKKEFAEELLTRLKGIVGVDKKFDTSIQMFIANEIKMDESLLGTNKFMSKLDKDFFTKLKLQFPQLSESDCKLCGLIRMDLSNKELAIVMNITHESMKSRKTRMSRKMNLPPGTILFEILKNI